jgi:GntR family transcriptional regulator, transcriptional repressor for pyruvate dehydrogenase complex
MSKVRKLSEFRPAVRRRIHEDIAEQLRDAILDGHFPPGARLPPERDLASEFQVNRTSIRDAIKVLEGLNLVRVRQGDGATVQPIADASFDLLPAMIFHGGQIDLPMITEMLEVVRPLLFEMARLALVRSTEKQIENLRALSAKMADFEHDEEGSGAASREFLVCLSDMTGNRVWQMLSRRLRTFLASDPLRETRRRLRKDHHRRLAALIDDCIEHRKRGRSDEALAALRRAVEFLGEGFELHESTKLRLAGNKR